MLKAVRLGYPDEGKGKGKGLKTKIKFIRLVISSNRKKTERFIPQNLNSLKSRFNHDHERDWFCYFAGVILKGTFLKKERERYMNSKFSWIDLRNDKICT